jgi:hypothetical protein
VIGLLSDGLACAADKWAWRIGDPHLVGWVIVALYLLAAFVSVRSARHAPFARERRFWWFAAVMALALALNKQLDLQAYVIQVGRCVAQIGGWYDIRRSVQATAFGVVALLCLLTGLLIFWAMRRSLPRIWPALLALVLMGSFVLLRGISLSHVDALMKMPVGSHLRINWVLEMTGPLMLMLAARHAAGPVGGRHPA